MKKVNGLTLKKKMKTTQQYDLSPCPECGAVGDKLTVLRRNGLSYVHCPQCGADGSAFYVELRAVNAWNSNGTCTSIAPSEQDE